MAVARKSLPRMATLVFVLVIKLGCVRCLSMIRAARAVKGVGSVDDDKAIIRLVREKGE